VVATQKFSGGSYDDIWYPESSKEVSRRAQVLIPAGVSSSVSATGNFTHSSLLSGLKTLTEI